MEIEFAYELLKEGDSKEGPPIDVHYASLKTDLDVLEKNSEEYNIIQKYLDNTHAETHNQYDLHIQQV